MVVIHTWVATFYKLFELTPLLAGYFFTYRLCIFLFACTSLKYFILVLKVVLPRTARLLGNTCLAMWKKWVYRQLFRGQTIMQWALTFRMYNVNSLVCCEWLLSTEFTNYGIFFSPLTCVLLQTVKWFL